MHVGAVGRTTWRDARVNHGPYQRDALMNRGAIGCAFGPVVAFDDEFEPEPVCCDGNDCIHQCAAHHEGDYAAVSAFVVASDLDDEFDSPTS